jgi:TPR repeat protein
MQVRAALVLLAACAGTSHPTPVTRTCADVAACEAGCTAQDGGACLRLGHLLETKQDPHAVDAYRKACQLKSLEGCVVVGEVALVGEKPDTAAARALFEQACSGGNQDGCGNLGTLYLRGIGVPQDAPKGVALLRPACNDGFFDACGNLGLAYALGLGVTADHGRARDLLDKACKGGKRDHCRNLAMVYSDGDADEQVHAAPMLGKLCEEGDAASCFNLAALFATGKTVMENREHASELLQKACDKGLAAACEALHH